MAATDRPHNRAGYVFGYGSLVAIAPLARFLGRTSLAAEDYVLCRLNGFRRSWNIAWDNSIEAPGYAHYVDRETGERYPGHVVVLNIRPDSSSAVNGIAFRVTPEELARLDRRERNYDRVEVTDLLDTALPAPVWTYRGKSEAEARYRRGLARGDAVINRAYREAVAAGFRSHGDDHYAAYRASTDRPRVALRSLDRARPARGYAASTGKR